MVDETLQKELMMALKRGVVDYDEDKVKKAAQKIIDQGLDAYDAVMNGLAAGMKIVGELYDQQEYFVPEMLLCTDALYAGLDILRPHIKMANVREQPKAGVVIGTVQGDVHDVGKNIVKTMLEVAGFQVHDLGRDVSLEKFVEEQHRTKAEIVALSAMMTTTMTGMKKAIEMLKQKSPNVVIMIGGAPVTKRTADLFGADGYAESGGNVVQEAMKLISRFR